MSETQRTRASAPTGCSALPLSSAPRSEMAPQEMGSLGGKGPRGELGPVSTLGVVTVLGDS